VLCIRSNLFEHIVNLLKWAHLRGDAAADGNCANSGLAHLEATEVAL
jgi:hypothetical protein